MVFSSHGFDQRGGFGTAFCISRLGLFLMYIFVYRSIREAKRHALLVLVSLLISMTCFASSIFTDSIPTVIALWISGIGVEMIASLFLPLPQKHRIRLHVGSLSLRQAYFVVFSFGESIIALIMSPPLVDISYLNYRYYLFLASSFYLVYSLHLTFHDNQPINEKSSLVHASFNSKLGGRLILLLHLLLTASILGMGSGLRILVLEVISFSSKNSIHIVEKDPPRLELMRNVERVRWVCCSF